MKELQSDEQEALDTYDRMFEATDGLTSVTRLAAAVILARAIRSSKYRPSVTGYYDDDE